MALRTCSLNAKGLIKVISAAGGFRFDCFLRLCVAKVISTMMKSDIKSDILRRYIDER